MSNRLTGNYLYEVFYNLMSLFGVGLVILIYSRIGRGNVLTKRLAPITFEIYLYHGLFIQIFRCDRLYIANDIAFLFAVYGATFVLSYVMHKISEAILNLIGCGRTSVKKGA